MGRVKAVRGCGTVALVAALLAWVPSGPAGADTGAASTKTEAWYNVTPVAGPGVAGTPAVVAPVYGSDTLHVGIVAGQETARTYLTLDLSAVGTGSLTGGTLTLPIDPGDGSSSPETARLLACFVPQPPADAAGATDPPPAYDCAAASSPATYLAGDSPSFAIDLAPLAAKLGQGGGLAVVPADGAKTDHDTWHVAFFGRRSTAAGAHPITATVTVTPAPVPAPAESTPAVSSPSTETAVPFTSSAAAPLLPRSPVIVNAPPEVGVPPAAAAPAVLGTAAPSAAVAATASPASAVSAVGGFAYSTVLLLPLALMALGCVLAWALTRSPVPDEV